MLRGRTLLLMWAILKVASTGKKYILPSLGLGGEAEDNGVGITLLLSNLGTDTVYPTATLKQNHTDILTYSCPVGNDDVKIEYMTNFQEDVLLNKSEMANKSIEVVATNFDFNLHVVYEKNGYSEGYVALSASDIGNEYYVSTFCALGGYCQIAMASVQSGVTRLYVKLPEEVDEVVICVGEMYWRSKYHTSFNLTYPETLQIETTHDLTGTFIYSDKPISVIAGTRSMPAQGGSLLHFMEQLVPVSQWGTEFVVRGFETAYGCVIHITSSERKTIVQMSGFKTVEMTGSGQTLKRRLEETTVSYIKSNKPIQVMVYVGITYGSYDAIYSVGMTNIPGKEHFQTSYVYNSNRENTFFQYVIEDGDTINSHSNAIVTKVPYTHYQVNTLNLTSTTDSNKKISSSSSSPFGGIFMLDTAVFPMAPTIATTTGCVADETMMSVGDGIDNDCDGSIDEDYCFEDAKITSTFIPGVTDKIPAYTTNVTGFFELLFRVQSCGTVLVELIDNSTGKIVVHISRAQMIIYKCFPKCDNIQSINTTSMLSNINCSR
ncbi:IgGFc-binding protein-like [Mercenaria mercenaria]|uniref:IgGFc-binding protein-like n=1 Tax=Mercenaria mercenaria TaxID=6596 RepID=UPI00234EDC6B|nr:IgGFc-binding protein-like [Mercenaria mercenaria]